MYADGLYAEPDDSYLSTCQGVFTKWQETLRWRCECSCRGRGREWNTWLVRCQGVAETEAQGKVHFQGTCMLTERGLKSRKWMEVEGLRNNLKRIRMKERKLNRKETKIRYGDRRTEVGAEWEEGKQRQEELIILEFSLRGEWVTHESSRLKHSVGWTRKVSVKYTKQPSSYRLSQSQRVLGPDRKNVSIHWSKEGHEQVPGRDTRRELGNQRLGLRRSSKNAHQGQTIWIQTLLQRSLNFLGSPWYLLI